MEKSKEERKDSTDLRAELVGSLIGLARATEGNDHLLTASTDAVMLDGLQLSGPGTAADCDSLLAMLARVDGEKRKLVPECYKCAASCGRTDNFDMERLLRLPEELRNLKQQILRESQEMAIRLAASPENGQAVVFSALYRALYAIGMEDWDEEELRSVLRDLEKAKA